MHEPEAAFSAPRLPSNRSALRRTSHNPSATTGQLHNLFTPVQEIHAIANAHQRLRRGRHRPARHALTRHAEAPALPLQRQPRTIQRRTRHLIKSRPRVPKPEYRHYCFVMARAARVFFDFARFAPEQPRLDAAVYRRLVREVLARNARSDPARREKIVLPGYANLHEFSRDHEALLKAAGGGNWRSFVQRGHWRIIFPFSRNNQAAMAARLRAELARGVAPVIHVVLFPEQTINHALVIYRVTETADGSRFSCYDPNDPGKPLELSYEATGRQFRFPATKYFSGGAVDVNEVYRNWLY